MNPRVTAGVIGAITVAMGLYGLASPASVLDFVGFDLKSTVPVAGLCEARAVYGGLFTVLGACTLWGAIDPAGKRSTLLMAALLWLGLSAGRTLGVVIDGNPGLFGLVGLVFELAFGAALLWASLARTATP